MNIGQIVLARIKQHWETQTALKKSATHSLSTNGVFFNQSHSHIIILIFRALTANNYRQLTPL